MKTVEKVCKSLVALALLFFVVPAVTFAQQYTRTDLVSSIPGDGTNAVNPRDTQLINAWGMTRSASSTWWISDNGTGLATLYNGAGTKQGLVILKVTEHHDTGVPALSEVEPKIQDAIYMERLQPALREYLTKLREDAFIDVKAGYVDSGASPNQTKPIETASKEPGARELKKKRKLGLF